MSIIKKMESDVASVLDALVAPTANISPQEAADQIYTIGIEFFNARSSPGSLADGEDDDAAPYNGPTTPGVPTFFYQLWETVISHVRLAPVDEQARNDRITRLLEFISQVKAKPQPDGKDWLLPGAVGRWDDLPRLAWSTRDYYDFIDSETSRYGTSAPESQAAIAGAIQLDPQHLDRAATDSDIIRLKRARYQWLTLQEFISRRWRECGTDECDYAIWALRPALEDWPESPPACDTKCETFEETAGYLAFRVEAACIWICNTAPLMYQCTKIFGPNGNPDWPENAGAPGRGGRRWNGVDGYDREHKRWQLWKDVLGEVVEWCDRAGQDQMKGWKVKDAAVRALEAMKAAEGQ